MTSHLTLRFPVTTWSLRDNVTEESIMEAACTGEDDHLGYEVVIEDAPRDSQDQRIAEPNSHPPAPTIRFDYPFVHQGFTTKFSAKYTPKPETTQPPSSKIFDSGQATETKTKHTMTTPIPPTYIDVIVGPPPHLIPSLPYFPPYSPKRQQTFHVPAALLKKHSAYFSRTTANPARLPHVNPHIFEDFLSYLNSSIYSPNTRASGLDILLQILQGWLLGEQLGAPGLRDAAFAKLYSELEYSVRERRPPLPPPPPPQSGTATDGAGTSTGADSWVAVPSATSRRRTTNGARHRRVPTDLDSPHVAFVCAYSPPGSLLRRLVFDATAALFDQEQVVQVLKLLVESRSNGTSTRSGSVNGSTSDVDMDDDADLSGGEASWLKVFKEHADFRAVLAGSVSMKDDLRGLLFRTVQEYIPGFGAAGK